jgi:ferredoxin
MAASGEPTGSELRVIHVDLDRCVGHGKCYLVAPDLMRPFDDDGHAEFYANPIDPKDAKRFAKGQAAIETCPEEAPSWRPAAGD